MKKNIWDVYAPFYKRFMRSDERAYGQMYEMIRSAISGKRVLEAATGPGLLARNVAAAARSITATDYSYAMIKEAEKGDKPENLKFEVADVTALPYTDSSFEAVIIANALHVIPQPERALAEIDRVLAAGGLLIAPNFIHKSNRLSSRLLAFILRLAGIRFEVKWSREEYEAFLQDNGWSVIKRRELPSRITMLYTECVRTGEEFG